MTLEELVGAADHEVWFQVIDLDGKKHLFWTADIFGGHTPTLKEFEPLEDLECDDFILILGTDPERGKRVPMVRVELMEPME